VTEQLSEELQEAKSNERLLPPVTKEEIHYVEEDGSMISTQADGWKEIKSGRLSEQTHYKKYYLRRQKTYMESPFSYFTN
jgi:hypothetical protein